MLEGIFEINSYEIDDLLSSINTTSNDVEVTNDEAKKDFEPYKKSEVFGKGAQKINDQVDAIFNNLESLGNVMQKGTTKIFETEMKILEEARDLEIPTGYDINNTVTDKAAKEVTLTKNDGTSVNEGIRASAIDAEMNSEIEKEALEDIRKEETLKQEFDGNALRTEEVQLGSIENEGTREVGYRDEYTEEKEQLSEMENKETEEIRDEVEIAETEKTVLGEMGNQNGGTEEQQVEFNDTEIKEQDLGNIGQ